MLRPTTITTAASRHLCHHHPRLPHRRSLLLRPVLSCYPNGSFNLANGDCSRPSVRQNSTLSAISSTATPTITAVLDTTQSLILTLHTTTSLPWLLTIPLVAIVVRSVITLPFTIYAYKRTNTQISLNPLIHAWTHVHRIQAAREVHPPFPQSSKELAGTKVYNSPQKWMKEVLVRTSTKRKEIYKKFGCQTWKGFVGLVQIPVWLVASLSVRRLTGVGDWWSPVDQEKLPDALGKAMPSMPSVDDLDVEISGSGSLSEPTISSAGSTTGIDEATLLVRQEMQKDGIEGWFTDLLQPDPLFILPIIFSFAMFTNVSTMGLRNSSDSKPASLTGWRKGLRNALMTMSIMVMPVTINTPSVLLLYWITSSSYSLVQNIALSRLMRPPKKIEPVPEKLPSWVKKEQDN